MTTVRFFHNEMPGAPTLSATAGTMISVLDACLVNGWGTGTVDSVVISGGIATVTRAAGIPFDVDCVAEIAGATTASGTINGKQKVLTVAGNVYTFATSATGPVTGTITHKVASLEWGKPYSGTNLAAYRSSDTAGTRMYLRIDDTGTVDGDSRTARAVGYESMSGISSGLVNPFPPNYAIAGGGSWAKSGTTDSTPRAWVLVGDSRGFLLWIRNSEPATVGFGDYKSLKTSDVHNCFLSCGSFNYAGQSFDDLSTIASPIYNTLWQPRGVSGIGRALQLGKHASSPVGGNGNGAVSGNMGMTFPNLSNNGLFFSEVTLYESTTHTTYRGTLPGVWFCPMSIGTSIFEHRERVTGVSGFGGRVLRQVPSRTGTPLFIDVTGPWVR
jgi:hypothetical protein